jgi:D-glycero-D-manno-heptose 1,7-bisphosphate phosphatase
VNAGWTGGGREPIALAGRSSSAAAGTGRARRAAVLLDRDGTLNELTADPDSGRPESPLAVGDVRLIEGAADAAARLAAAEYALVCVSNQPAAAKNKATVGQLQAVHEQVLRLLARRGVEIELSLLCLHHPEGSVAALSGACECRKPAPGMLLQAAAALDLDLAASWMIGDTDTDVGAGHAAGCQTVLLDHLPSAHKRAGKADPDERARDLADAAKRLLGSGAA